jgi:NADH:ubiquinone oxidoreductase subunit 2 (subunit N)
MLVRICLEGLPIVNAEWRQLFYVLAVLSMTFGNVAAVTQSNVKRMLAYSSIAHAGYLLIGLVTASPRGITAMLVYLMVYAFMQLGAFGVLAFVRRRDVVGDDPWEGQTLEWATSSPPPRHNFKGRLPEITGYAPLFDARERSRSAAPPQSAQAETAP